ncbi:STM4014 family protein [Pendulispora rubella]|uniref:STM4014 family protein n=1 Tax=Pendulispora rubella TaxID=2741070 RepID=A0ABZ2L4Q4_9BACT
MTIGTAPSRSECVVIGSPGDERIERFQSAVQRRGWPQPTVVSYRELSEHGPGALAAHVRSGTLVRIESPGSSFESFAALVRAGGGTHDEPLAFERGRLRHVRAWYLGLCRVLQDIAPLLPAGRTMGHPSDIACMFDKRHCHRHLMSHAVPVPPAFPAPDTFEALLVRMREQGMPRVFVKLAHGSSASGVVALHADARGVHALTTVERSGSKLYNSKRLLFYRDVRALAAIYETLACEGLHIEAWLPKIGLDNRPVDLRILVIAGRARHVVARAGHGPITNLHIGARRADPERLRAKIGDSAWARAVATAEKASKTFPNSLAVGVDLLVEPDPRRIAVLEMNAFGDLLRGALHDGEDPYEAQLTEMAPC